MLDLEIKFAPEADGEIVGYASLFGGPADAVNDIVSRGAFRASLAAGLPLLLREHKGEPVGKWLDVEEDDIGLRVRGRVTDPATLADLRGGRLDGLSIGYVAIEIHRDPSGRRVLDRVNLEEISIVKRPASSRARVLSVKSSPAAAAAQQKAKTMTDQTTAAADATDNAPIADRVTALETTVHGIDERLKKVEDATATTAKGVKSIETILRRPGTAVPEVKSADLETKALAVFARTGNEIEIKAASVGSDPDGGYSVLPQLDTTIRKVARDVTPLRSLANVVTLNSDAYEVLVDVSDTGATWIGETGDRVETDSPQLVKIAIPAHEIYAAPRATQKLLDDASVDIAGWLTGAVADKFARTEATAFVSGDGTGKPTGFLSVETDSAADFTRTWNKLQFVASGNASAITADALVSLAMALRAPYRTGAAWLMNRATATVVRQMKDGADRYLWGDGSVNNGQPDNLLGFPVVLSEDMPSIAAGTFPIALGNWRAGYTIVDRHGVRLIRDNLTAKPYTIFYCYRRVGGAVTDHNAIKLLKIAA